MIELWQSGPCCNLTIHYKEPLEIEVDYDIHTQDGVAYRTWVKNLPQISSFGETLEDSLKCLYGELCVVAQDTSLSYCSDLRKLIDHWTWEVPEDTWAVGIIDKTKVVIENNKDKE